MRLSIIIPAYNEEQSIAEIVERCLKARETLMREMGLEKVEVIVVDDGSRDRTREIASRFTEARVVSHARNRGYGQALMTGFEAAEGELLSFLDADGTLDPLSLVPLHRAMREADADLSIGSRMHPESHMPAVRVVGNIFYATIISRLTGVPVKDSASGLRLFRRGLLERLKPLPTGLHFTPAMTARAACLGARIVETPVPYAERQGRSKLNVVADGVRFLRVILGIIFSYYPLKIFGPAGLFFAAVALGYGIWPVSYYLRFGRLEPEVMIYRLLTIVTLSAVSLICLTTGGLAQKLSDIATGRESGAWDHPRLQELALGLGLALVAGAALLNWSTIREYVSTGRITTHWIYVLTGSLGVLCGTLLAAFGVAYGLAGHLPRRRP